MSGTNQQPLQGVLLAPATRAPPSFSASPFYAASLTTARCSLCAQVAKGEHTKRKIVSVAAMSREALFNRLTEAMAKGFVVAPERPVPRRGRR